MSISGPEDFGKVPAPPAGEDSGVAGEDPGGPGPVPGPFIEEDDEAGEDDIAVEDADPSHGFARIAASTASLHQPWFPECEAAALAEMRQNVQRLCTAGRGICAQAEKLAALPAVPKATIYR